MTNSLIFGNHLDFLPVMFQPIMFYTDWFFMVWPLKLYLLITGHSMDNTDPVALVWSVIWLVGGFVCGVLNTSESFTDTLDTELQFPLRVIYKFFAYVLFWHIVIASILTAVFICMLPRNYTVQSVVKRIVFGLMLGPPIIMMIISLVIVFLKLVS